MIQKAIIFTPAGGVFRNGHDIPAPLVKVAGIPLIKRTLQALEHQGVHDVVMVLGHQGDEVRSFVESDSEITSNIKWLDTKAGASSGIRSLMGAGGFINGPAVVLSSQLLFAPEVLAACDHPVLSSRETRLVVDRKVSRVFDLDTALKVRTAGDQVISAASDLPGFDAVAVGIAVVPPEHLEALDTDASSLTFEELVTRAVRFRPMRALDIGESLWQEVTNPENLRHAEWMLRAYGEDLGGNGARPSAPSPHSTERTLSYIEGLLSEKNARHYTLFNPGPVLTSPRVKSALVHHDVCHRDSDYSSVFRGLQRKIRRVCKGGPEHDVILLSGSGTAAMEAAISSAVPPDGKLLVVSNGAFGERFAEIARVHRIQTVHLRYEWGQLIDTRDVSRELASDPEIVAAIMCHHETSVGILNPVREVGRICRERNLLFMVDTVSSLAGEDVDVRRDNIDLLISSANKCIHAISGVSFVCVHNRVWPRIADLPPRVYYLDLRRYHKISEELSQTPFTPAVSNFFALDAALDELLKIGVQARIDHYREVNARIRKALEGMGLRRFTTTGQESHSITTFATPSYIPFDELYEEMKRRGYIIYACKAPLGDRYFQIANMGELSDEMIQGFLDTLGQVLAEAAARFNRAGATVLDITRARA